MLLGPFGKEDLLRSIDFLCRIMKFVTDFFHEPLQFILWFLNDGVDLSY